MNGEKKQILGWINSGFKLSITHTGDFFESDKMETINISLLSPDDFKEVFSVIKNYIKSHRDEFSLGRSTHDKLIKLEAEKKTARPWYSPIVPPESPRTAGDLTPQATASIQGWKIGQIRIIVHSSGNILYPNVFTEEQWEEMRLLIPGACQAAGCIDYLIFNDNYPGWWDDTGNVMIGDYCRFHTAYPDYYKDRDWRTGITPSRPSSNSGSSSPSSPPNSTGTGGTGNAGSGDGPIRLKKRAIREIENELTNNHFPLSGEGVWNEVNWKNNPIYFTSSPQNIQADKEFFLNQIYRQAAINDLRTTLAVKSFSVTILGLPSNNLVQHFRNFSGKINIAAEKHRLKNFIHNHRPDRSAEISTAIAEIRAKLKAERIDSAKEAKILGNAWETNFRTSFRYETSQKIIDQSKSLIAAIDKYLTEKAATSQKIIAEIEKMLQNNGFSESILGANWRTNLSNQSQNEQQITKNSLIKLIYQAIHQRTDLSDEERKTKKKQLIINSITSAKSSIQIRQTGVHAKLKVSEAEIPVSILAPYRTIEEKLDACSTVDEVSNLENQLLLAIDQQQETKLTAIQEEAIAQIKAELKKSGKEELGLNENFAIMIKGMVNPDQIESKKNLILNLLIEQRSQSQEGDLENDQNSKTSPFQNWPLILGSTLIVVILLAIIALFAFKPQQRRRRI